MPGPFHTLDVICARRQALIYVSSPVCEVDFSSSGEPVIVLNPFRRRRGPTGFRADVVNGRIRFRWDTSDGAICYSLYRREGGVYVLVAECIGECTIDTCEYTCETCGPGTYVVTVITADGESEVSDEVTVGGFAPECPDVAGQPVPIGVDAFDIDAPVEWAEMTINQAEFTPWPSDSRYVTQEWPEPGSDYPPGHYDVKLVTGFFDQGPSGPNVCGEVILFGVFDDDYNIDTEVVGPWVTKNIYLSDPPFTEIIAQGISFCGLSYASVEAQHQSFWNGGTRRRFKQQHKHENDGGKLLAAWDSNSITSFDTVVGFDYKLQLIQTDGLIQQDRQIKIEGWDFIKGFFSPALQSWDGIFSERTTYVSDALVYTAPGFAQAYYVGTGHPTSPNGAGWILEIGGGGGEYVAYKTIDSNILGQFRRSVGSQNIPACVVLIPHEEEA